MMFGLVRWTCVRGPGGSTVTAARVVRYKTQTLYHLSIRIPALNLLLTQQCTGGSTGLITDQGQLSSRFL